jgi:hypothetical protein
MCSRCTAFMTNIRTYVIWLAAVVNESACMCSAGAVSSPAVRGITEMLDHGAARHVQHSSDGSSVARACVVDVPVAEGLSSTDPCKGVLFRVAKHTACMRPTSLPVTSMLVSVKLA